MKTLKTLALATAVSAGLVMMNAQAAPRLDGVLGGTSDAEFDITLTTASQAKIWGLEDVVLTSNGSGNVTDTDPTRKFCVFSNSTAGSNEFKLTISSANFAETAPFKLVDLTGSKAAIPYEIVVGDGATNLTGNSTTGSSGSVFDDLNAGNLSAQPNPTAPCTNGQMSLAVSVADPIATAAGTYSDTITMTVEPI